MALYRRLLAGDAILAHWASFWRIPFRVDAYKVRLTFPCREGWPAMVSNQGTMRASRSSAARGARTALALSAGYERENAPQYADAGASYPPDVRFTPEADIARMPLRGSVTATFRLKINTGIANLTLRLGTRTRAQSPHSAPHHRAQLNSIFDIVRRVRIFAGHPFYNCNPRIKHQITARLRKRS
jgi:hypothetical protein